MGIALDLKLEWGLRVNQPHLERYWNTIRRYLEEKGYPVGKIKMPEIEAFIVTPKHFETIRTKLRKARVDSSFEEEYQRTETLEDEPTALLLRLSDEWKIIVVQPFEELESQISIFHELLHIWEHFWDLKAGSLIGEFENELDQQIEKMPLTTKGFKIWD